jgi:DNA-binding GntR family transcriptional regulator
MTGIEKLLRNSEPPERTTTNEEVYRKIRMMIATCELAQGTPLVVRTLAAQLGVSRTPVVEALRRLERDGLIHAVPKWGATVKTWTWEEVLGVHHVRRGLEGEAARLFVMRASEPEKQRLVELSHAFDEAGIHDSARIDEYDIALHVHIARGAHCPHLYDLIANSHIETIAILGSTIMMGGIRRGEVNIGVHAPLVEALLGTNPDAARDELVKHIDTTLEAYHQLRGEAAEAASENSISAL